MYCCHSRNSSFAIPPDESIGPSSKVFVRLCAGFCFLRSVFAACRLKLRRRYRKVKRRQQAYARTSFAQQKHSLDMTDTANPVSRRNFHRRMRRSYGSVSRTVLLVAKRRSCNPVVFASLARRPGLVSSVRKSMWPQQRGHAHHARPRAVAWEQREHAWQCGA